jgi:hypothetical protein
MELSNKTLTEVVSAYPFPEYQTWWHLGNDFVRFMSQAIFSEWELLERPLAEIHSFTNHYIQVVYQRKTDPDLVFNFVGQTFYQPLSSGEFDGVSYAFYRSTFEQMDRRNGFYGLPLEKARREFTKRVGRKFFIQLHDHLKLELPSSLDTEIDFSFLGKNIQRVGEFLTQQGYLRDHFAFPFDVHVTHRSRSISQTQAAFLPALKREGVAYALYEMGYPVILPSAVYLYQTIGEAQHHSSRTIEELFARVGCDARETDDFDPTGFPSDRVVELWEIRQQS